MYGNINAADNAIGKGGMKILAEHEWKNLKVLSLSEDDFTQANASLLTKILATS
jgi:hypothetical protein